MDSSHEKMFQAIKDYNGSDSEKCISLATGDWLSSVHAVDTDWYIGRNERSGETGAFPASHVIDKSHGKTLVSGIAGSDTDKIFAVSDSSAETTLSYQPQMHRAFSNPESVVSWQDSTFESSFHGSGEGKGFQNKVNIVSTENTECSLKCQKRDKLGVLMASTDMLFHSGREENKRMKAAFGAFAGLMIGCLLFVLLVFSFGYSELVAGILTLVCTIFICIGLAIFPACRCVMALVFPNFFTGKGRTILLSVIFAVILSGPILNITRNAKETGNSMACVIDLISNQTRYLRNQLEDPTKNITSYVNQQRETLRKIRDGITVDFESTEKALAALRKEFDALNNNLNRLYQRCIQPIADANKECTSLCQKLIFDYLKQECLTQCSSINSLADLCTHLKIGTSFAELSNQLKSTLDKAERFYKVDVTIETKFMGDTNSTKEMKLIQKDVNDDIETKVITFQTFMTVVNYVLSLSLFLMFLQAYLYFRNYMAKDGYDNVYITKQFIELDKKKEVDEEETVLPLKKIEQSEYISTRSLKLNKQEFSNCKVGLAQVFLHFTFCIVVIISDYCLYYLLNLVHKFGNIDIKVSGSGRFTISVNGGYIASFYRRLFEGINVHESFLVELRVGKCLPNPTSPTGEYAIILILLYLFAVCFVILRGYGMRLRRKISAYYYPEQENARMEYLHKTIRHRRMARTRFLRQEVKSTHKESTMKEKFRLSTWLASHCPCMAKCIPSRKKLACSSCEEQEGKFHHVKLTKCPGVMNGVACKAVYCEDCQIILNGVCPLCTQEEFELRD